MSALPQRTPLPIVAAALALLMPAVVQGQPPLTVEPPHELIQGNSEREAELLGESRQWAFEDGTYFTGQLYRWHTTDGLVRMRNLLGRTSTFPLRQFSEQTRKESSRCLARMPSSSSAWPASPRRR